MRENKNWQEQRKAVVAHKNGVRMEFISLWQASKYISDMKGCRQDTAKKMIRAAIRQGYTRYGMTWLWKS